MTTDKYTFELKKFGNRLRQIRKKKNLTLLDLEAITGIGNGNISRIENGLKNIEFFTIVRLAEALEVEVYQLFPKHNNL